MLIDLIVEDFKKSLTAVFKKEAESKTYMNQSIFGCRWRAFKGTLVIFKNSFARFYRMLALGICLHRQEPEHGENKTKTIQSLMMKMPSEDISRSTNFWN